MTAASWAATAADLLLGARCPGCERPAWGICPDCRQASSRFGCYQTRPDPSPRGFPDTVTTSPYDAVMKRLIAAHKERQVLTLTPYLAERLSAAVELLLHSNQHLGPTSVVLVPVPSSPAAVRARGLDATWALATRAARQERMPAQVRAQRMLRLSRRVQDQARLGAVARQQNLAGSFAVHGARLPPAAAVVIVDDVVTTGASLAEAARALRTAGIPVLGAATVAATVRSSSVTSPAKERAA